MSLLRNLATSLVNSRNERLITTVPKAKELRPFIERAITLSRHARALSGDEAAAQRVHLRRQAAGFFHAGNHGAATATSRKSTSGAQRPARTAGVAALKRLFDELGERYAERPGGYTRIIRLGRRDGDNAELAIIEFVGGAAEIKYAGNDTPRVSDKKTARASQSRAASGGRRGGRKSDKTYEKPETTEKRGTDAVVPDDTAQTSGGRRSQKTESTAQEKDTD